MARKPRENRKKAVAKVFAREGYHVNTAQVREEFLTHLRNGASKQLAADMCGHSRSQFAKIEREDEEFAAAVAEAIEGGNDRVDDEVWRRGVRGIRKAIYHQGKIVAYERVYSDRMLELRARRSGRYAAEGAQVQVNVQNNTFDKMSLEELEKELEKRGLPIGLLEV